MPPTFRISHPNFERASAALDLHRRFLERHNPFGERVRSLLERANPFLDLYERRYVAALRFLDRLIHPESGIGYQKVNIVLKRGQVLKDVIVLNAEEAQVPESFDPAEIMDVQLAR